MKAPYKMWITLCTDGSLNIAQNIVKNSDFFINDIVKYVNVLTAHPNKDIINKFALNKNTYDYIICVSPNGVNCIHDHVVTIKDTVKFIVMGMESYKLLKMYTKNTALYPKHSTGMKAVFDQIIFYNQKDFVNKKIAVLKGFGNTNTSNIINDNMNALNALNVQIDYFDIYTTEFVNISPEIINTIFINKLLKGIIFTSSSIVRWFFSDIGPGKYISNLMDLCFVAWHDEIIDTLYEYKLTNIKHTHRL